MPHLPDAVWPGSEPVTAGRVSRALHRAAAAFADQGFDLIVDGILPYGRPDDLADALAIFRCYRLCYVGVHCELDVLEERERSRAGQTVGLARKQHADLHAGQAYDVVVDTTASRAEDVAVRICEYLQM